jgi:hypothetical protein
MRCARCVFATCSFLSTIAGCIVADRHLMAEPLSRVIDTIATIETEVPLRTPPIELGLR